jgi:ABC-type transport system substrate-binding protein
MSDSYWKRKLARQGISRRRVLGGAATAGLGAAALGLVGCAPADDEPAAATPTPPGQPAPDATPTPIVKQKGGTARFTSAGNTWDTFDVDRSRFTPISVMFGWTNLGIVQWDSYTKGVIGGALAEKWEQPDRQTLVFTLQPNVFWHDKPPVNGRAARAEDIAKFIERNVAGRLRDGTEDPNFYRKAAFQIVDRVETVDEKTVRVTLKSPNPFFLNTLAGAYAKVQAPEAIDAFEKDYANMRPELVIGTGGMVLTSFASDGEVAYVRHDKFHRQVNWDGVKYMNLFVDQTAQLAAFEQKQMDLFSPTRNAIADDLLRRFTGQINETKQFSANPQAGTYYGGAEPWSNPNLIGAIFRALDRRSLVQSLLEGNAALSGNVPPTQSAFTITEKELITFPGYLEDRAKEEAEAKKMWDAGGGPALGEIIVDIPNIWEGLYSGGAALITTQLNRVLGNKFTAKIEPYSTITGKIVRREYGNGRNNIWYGWITEITDPEPSMLNYLQYNSKNPQFAQFGVKIDKVDQLTDSLMTEFDMAKRQETNKEITRELIRHYGAGIPYTLVAVSRILRWNYFRHGEVVPFVTSHQAVTESWFDQTDPTWRGRPA